jgi:FMN-dependent NADH-azoreductase
MMAASFSGATMRHLLFVRGSIFGDEGQSSKLADAFLQRFEASHPDATIVVRDVQNPSLPHLDAATFQAFLKPPEAVTEADRVLLRLSDELIAELRAATDLLIALPLYNFAIPSAFKAWIDHVARVRTTFRYTATGPEGMLGNIKNCWIMAARGGQYQGTTNDTQTPYVTLMLGFLGIPKPVFVYAEGLSRPDARVQSLANATAAVAELDL